MGEIFQTILERASLHSRRIVYANPEDIRILRGAIEVQARGLAQPVLVGDPARLLEHGRRNGLSLSRIEIRSIDPASVARYASAGPPMWKAKGLGETESCERLRDPVEFSAAMVRAEDADGMIVGPAPAMERPWQVAGGFAGSSGLFRYFLAEVSPGRGLRDQCMVFASSSVRSNPSALDLATAGLGAAHQMRRLLGQEPRLAYVSLGVTATLEAPNRFKTAQQILVERVREAIETVQARDESFRTSRQLYSSIPGRADPAPGRDGDAEPAPNTFVFASERGASLHALIELLPGARVRGPLIGGLERPVNYLSSSCAVEEVVDITAITCLS